MKVEYDRHADALYLYLVSPKKKKVWKSQEIKPGIIIDIDKDHTILGIELLDVSRRYKPCDLFEFSVRQEPAIAAKTVIRQRV